MSVFKNNKSGGVTKVLFTNDMMTIAFDTGREVLIPLEWYPGLKDASPDQLNNWELIDNGNKLYWKDLDEVMSIGKLF